MERMHKLLLRISLPGYPSGSCSNHLGIQGGSRSCLQTTTSSNHAGVQAALLAGKRLLPFWRGDPSRGVNLRRVFTEPRPFDLVLWVQGTAATPYLEKGPLTKPEVWRRLRPGSGGTSFSAATRSEALFSREGCTTPIVVQSACFFASRAPYFALQISRSYNCW